MNVSEAVDRRMSVRAFLPDADWGTVYFTNAGVRALVRKEGVSESAVSRKHQIVDHAETPDRLSGLISVVGGKITVILNGKKVNTCTEANPHKGRILLQSEGAEIFFRRIDLKPLPK